MGIFQLILNSLNEKNYLKNKGKLKLYDKSAKNIVELPNQAEKLQYIKHFEIAIRHENLKVYLKNMLKLRGKQFVVFVAPIVLSGLTILSGCIKRTKEVDAKIYKKHEIIFDEENILVDQIHDNLYTTTGFVLAECVDKEIDYIGSTDESLEIFYGNGADTAKVNYDIDSNNEIVFQDIANGTFYNVYESSESKEVDEQYKKLLEYAIDEYLSLGSNSNNSKIINEAISNDFNDILVKLYKYEYVGNKQLDYVKANFPLTLNYLIIDLIYVVLLYKLFNNLIEVKKLSCTDKQLYEESLSKINIRYASLEYREAFFKAEIGRINAINEILEKHANEKDILTEYEKKLILKENE